MGVITETALRDSVVDFSYPYFFTRVGFVTKKPSQLPKILALVLPYERRVWICLGVGLAAFNLLNWIVSKICQNRFTPSFNLSKVILQVSQKLMTNGKTTIDHIPMHIIAGS